MTLSGHSLMRGRCPLFEGAAERAISYGITRSMPYSKTQLCQSQQLGEPYCVLSGAVAVGIFVSGPISITAVGGALKLERANKETLSLSLFAVSQTSKLFT